MRTILFAMPGPLGAAALPTLLAVGTELIALALPAPPGAPPAAALPAAPAPPHPIMLSGPPAPPSLPSLAAAHGVPLLALRKLGHPSVAAALAALRPDALIVACWPWRLPPQLLALPHLGCLNLHPAPLPTLRGPAPLFWAFQRGLAQTAVTLHWMDASLDTGPIALQAALALPAGISWEQAEAEAAALGASLLAEALPALATGRLPRQAQGTGAGYAPSPSPADFRLDPHWPAERAFRFMRGTANWGQPYPISIGATTLQLRTALSYAPAEQLGAPYLISGAITRVQMTPGVLVST